MRGAGLRGTSIACVSGVLLLEELGCCALAKGAEALRSNKTAKHREKSAGCRKDDLAGKDTVDSTLP